MGGLCGHLTENTLPQKPKQLEMGHSVEELPD